MWFLRALPYNFGVICVPYPLSFFSCVNLHCQSPVGTAISLSTLCFRISMSCYSPYKPHFPTHFLYISSFSDYFCAVHFHLKIWNWNCRWKNYVVFVFIGLVTSSNIFISRYIHLSANFSIPFFFTSE